MQQEDALNIGYVTGAYSTQKAIIIIKTYCKERGIDYETVLPLIKNANKIMENLNLNHGIVGR